jgi:hypothetical protein
MAITKQQLYEHCRPLISRKSADLSFMKDTLNGNSSAALELARSFMKFEPGFEAKLNSAPQEVSGSIREILKGLGGEVHPKTAVERLRHAFLKYSLYLESDHDPGVWFVIRRIDAGETAMSLMIGPYEKLRNDADYIHNGRLHIAKDGSASELRLSVSAAAARVAELLDLWLSPFDGLDETERNERMLYRLNDEGIGKWIESGDRSPETLGFDFTLYAISMRASFARFGELLEASDTPREFLNEALNDQLESVAIHELGHIAETRLNGVGKFSEEKKEQIAYLLAAAYSYAPIAFRSLISHGHSLSSLPYLCNEMGRIGSEALLQGEDFLVQMAFDLLDTEFISHHDDHHDAVLDLSAIRSIRNTELVLPEHMEIIEKAMFNPSWRK